MAVEFATEFNVARGDALYRVWPEDIEVIAELNGRHENTDIEELAADIDKNGQDNPILIRKNDDGRPVLVAGHRRYRAVCLLNERDPKNPRALICRYKILSDMEAFQATVRENRFRHDVSPVDDATNIKILRDRFSLAVEDIAKIYFPEAKTEKPLADAIHWVEQRIALIELAPEAAQAVRDGRIKAITAAVELSKLSKNQQRKKVEKTGAITFADIKPPTKKTVELRELLKKVKGILADVIGTMLEDKELEYIEIERELLLDLSNYVSGNQSV